MPRKRARTQIQPQPRRRIPRPRRFPPPTPVTTILTPLERIRVDVAAQGAYTTIHRSSIEQVLHDLREKKADAVIFSVGRYDPNTTARIAAMVNEFPRVPTFALLTDLQKSSPHSVLSLGQLGVRKLVDARQAQGWGTLRQLLINEQTTDIQHVTVSQISDDLADVPPDCWRFFELLFAHRPHIASVHQIARLMNVIPTTLISRFYRAKLPSPKKYIALGRLIRVARYLENLGLSVTTVAKQLEYSSAQAFSRHTRCMLGLSPVEFRKAHTGESMLTLFREQMILPYLDILREFHPISAEPGWTIPRPPDEELSTPPPTPRPRRRSTTPSASRSPKP